MQKVTAECINNQGYENILKLSEKYDLCYVSPSHVCGDGNMEGFTFSIKRFKIINDKSK